MPLVAPMENHPIRCVHAGTGPPMLLIHGLLGGSFCWRFSAPVLARSYAVHAVDLPGLAFSEDIGAECGMFCQAERLFQYVERQGWSGLTVIGSSFGGAVAMLLAARDAQASCRIRSLVLAAPVNPWSSFGQGRIRFFNTVLGGVLLRMLLPISRPCHRIAVRRMYGDPKRMPPDAVQGYHSSILRKGRAQNVLTALRSWEKDVASLRMAIPQIDIPVLLVWGDRDGAVDPRSAAIMQQHLPNAQIKFIPGAGHLPFEEMPVEFNRVVMEFLGLGC
jgi:pimeloyl-ACP methyl ester carboxylesterase